jgi:4-amino-4-deoxy-L-arabinose transferase-like glycosyltransferase
LALAAITLCGAFLRLQGLNAQPLWLDEVVSLHNAGVFGAGGLRALAGADHIAPLHSMLLWAVISLGGESAVPLRLPSALFGIATVPVVFILAKRLLGSTRTALIGAALAAVSPYAIWYSQEARMYSLFLLCACLYVIVAWPVVSRSLGFLELSALTVITTAGLYTQHYMIMLTVAFGLFLVSRGGLTQKKAWAWLATQILSLLLFSYWLYLTADKLDAIAGFPKPGILMWIPYTLFNFAFGFSLGPSVREIREAGASAAMLHHGLAIAMAGAAMGLICLTGIWRALRSETRTAGIWLAMWLVVPILIALLATFVTNIGYNSRYVIVSYPPMVLFLALGLEQALSGFPQAVQRPAGYMRWPIAVAAALLAACMATSLYNSHTADDYAKEEVRPLAHLLSAGRDAGILVVADNAHIQPVLLYYGASLPPDFLAIDNAIPGRTADAVLRDFDKRMAVPPVEIWLLQYRTWEADPEASLKSRVERVGSLIEKRDWPGVSLSRYRVR